MGTLPPLDQLAPGLRQRNHSSKEPLTRPDQTTSIPLPLPLPSSTTQQDDPAVSYGKTPSGQIFAIPKTTSFLHSLLNPFSPKSNIDLLTLFTLTTQILLFLVMGKDKARWVFGMSFAVWRVAYNVGLGWVLTRQSKERWIVKKAKEYGLFNEEKRGGEGTTWAEKELEMKMGKGYDTKVMS